MLHDQHCHTNYSLDSVAQLIEYYRIASKYNCKYFITTEHIEFLSVTNHQNWNVDFQKLKEELTNLSKTFKNTIPLLGLEIGYKKTYINDMNKVINSHNFDVVNMSIHDNDIYDYYEKDAFISLGINKMLDIYFNNIIDGLIRFNNFDVLSHFDYGFKTAYLIDNTLTIDIYEDIVRKIFKLVIEKGKTLEINIKVQNTLGVEHLQKVLRWYKEEGGTKLTLSSDSHKEEVYNAYYQNQQKYLMIIKDAGFNELRYFVKRKEYIYKID